MPLPPKTFSIILPRELYFALRAEAARGGRSMGRAIFVRIEDWLKSLPPAGPDGPTDDDESDRLPDSTGA